MYLEKLITRSAPRIVDQRSEPRHGAVIDQATITFRGERIAVPVVDISSRGTRVVSGIVPRIGETISVQFDDCSRIQAFVRWVKDGQLGLNFGHEIILEA